MNYLKRIEDNFSFKKNKIMVMLVAAVLIVALLVPAFYNSKNATNSNEIDTTTLENYLSNQI
jgi:Ca2+/H+ antiporter